MTQDDDVRFDVAQDHAFGNFQIQPAGVEFGLVQDIRHQVRQVAFLELARRQIHRDTDRQQSGMLPRLVLPACGAQHPLPDRHNQSDFFGQRNKLCRRDDRGAVFPTNQGFDADHAPAAQIHLWLVLQKKFIAFHGLPQLRLQCQSRGDSHMQLRCIELKIVTPLFLGAIHRGISIFQQGGGVGTVNRIQAETDTAGHFQRVAVDEERG